MELFFLESLFENVSDSILVIDRDGYIMGANKAAETMTGWTREELVGNIHLCDVCQGMATCTQEAACFECFTKRLQFPSFEIKVKRKDGSEFPVFASSTRLPEEEIAALVLILRDMSEQQRTERERFQRMMTSHMIHAQEEERKRISRDLHDGIGQALYSVLVGLNVVHQLDLDKSVRNLVHEIQQMTANALDEAKSLAVELRPSTLDDLGLLPAIRSYLKSFEQTFGILTELEIVGKKRRLSPVIETALYRICQEAMTNAAKYADTDKLKVRLHDNGEVIELCIEDHGKGFLPEEIEIMGTGLGLFGMKERANLLGGKLEILSISAKGTTIQVFIPLNERGEPANVDPSAYRR